MSNKQYDELVNNKKRLENDRTEKNNEYDTKIADLGAKIGRIEHEKASLTATMDAENFDSAQRIKTIDEQIKVIEEAAKEEYREDSIKLVEENKQLGEKKSDLEEQIREQGTNILNAKNSVEYSQEKTDVEINMYKGLLIELHVTNEKIQYNEVRMEYNEQEIKRIEVAGGMYIEYTPYSKTNINNIKISEIEKNVEVPVDIADENLEKPEVSLEAVTPSFVVPTVTDNPEVSPNVNYDPVILPVFEPKEEIKESIEEKPLMGFIEVTDDGIVLLHKGYVKALANFAENMLDGSVVEFTLNVPVNSNVR